MPQKQEIFAFSNSEKTTGPYCRQSASPRFTEQHFSNDETIPHRAAKSKRIEVIS
jgi:hypothetical protein